MNDFCKGWIAAFLMVFLIAVVFIFAFPPKACASIMPDFSMVDQQEHALSGCAISLITRSVFQDLELKHPALVGASVGIAVGFLQYTVPHSTGFTDEHMQDAMANLVGSVGCVALTEMISLAIKPNGFNLIWKTK